MELLRITARSIGLAPENASKLTPASDSPMVDSPPESLYVSAIVRLQLLVMQVSSKVNCAVTSGRKLGLSPPRIGAPLKLKPSRKTAGGHPSQRLEG